MRVARSEPGSAATGWLIKRFGNLNGRVARILEVCCHLCAPQMNDAQRARSCNFPRNCGVGAACWRCCRGEFAACAWSPVLESPGNSIVASWLLERLEAHIGRLPLG